MNSAVPGKSRQCSPHPDGGHWHRKKHKEGRSAPATVTPALLQSSVYQCETLSDPPRQMCLFAETRQENTKLSPLGALVDVILVGDRSICSAREVVAICKARRDSEPKGGIRELVTAVDDKPAVVSRPNLLDLRVTTRQASAANRRTRLQRWARARASFGEVAGPSRGPRPYSDIVGRGPFSTSTVTHQELMTTGLPRKSSKQANPTSARTTAWRSWHAGACQLVEE